MMPSDIDEEEKKEECDGEETQPYIDSPELTQKDDSSELIQKHEDESSHFLRGTQPSPEPYEHDTGSLYEDTQSDEAPCELTPRARCAQISGGDQREKDVCEVLVNLELTTAFQELLGNTHHPWLDDFHPWMIGYRSSDGTTLFDCRQLRHIAVPPGKSREAYFVDLFFQKRYFEAQKSSSFDPAKRSSPNALAEAWASFVKAMSTSSASEAWIARLEKTRQKFFAYNIEGAKIEIHQRSIFEKVPCCIRREQKCPMCYADSARAPSRTRSGRNNRISPELHTLLRDFDVRWGEHISQQRDDALVKRLAQEEEETYLAQMDQAWIEQHMRNTDTEVFKVYTMNLRLKRMMDEMAVREESTQNTVAELREDLADVHKTLDEAGILRRQRLN
ncbi:hypothetical protein DVH05_006681 [Phytophthora capsici]|nr:hypothetical protein DVH05_006681 [Phytophthora capsici]